MALFDLVSSPISQHSVWSEITSRSTRPRQPVSHVAVTSRQWMQSQSTETCIIGDRALSTPIMHQLACSGCGRPHNAHTTAKINTRTDILISVFIPHQDFIFCQKTSWANVFTAYFFTHIHLMICLSSMVNLIAAMTRLLTSSLHRC